MSDLIERLRCVDSIQKEIDVSIICEQAADEIELARNCKLAVVIAKERMAEQDNRIEKLEKVLEAAKVVERAGPLMTFDERNDLRVAIAEVSSDRKTKEGVDCDTDEKRR